MQDLIWLIRKTMLSTFKNYKNWLLYIGLPVTAVMLSLLIQGGGSGGVTLTMGIVNEDGDGQQALTQHTIAFIDRLDSVETREVAASEVNSLVASGELDAVLLFPAGFAQSLLEGRPETIRFVSVKGAAVTGHVQAYLNPYIDNIARIGTAAGGNEDLFASLYADFREASFALSPEKVEDRSVNYDVARQTIGYMVIIMLFAAATLAGIMVKEREDRTYHRIIASAVSARMYVLSNIVVNLFMMGLQIALTLLLMKTVLRIDPGMPYGLLFVLLLLFALVAISLSLVIVAFSSSSQFATGLQSMIFFPTCILAGCMFPIDALPSFLQNVAFFLPQYWLMETFGKLQLGSSLGSLSANLLILLAFAAALSLIAAYKVSRANDVRKFV